MTSEINTTDYPIPQILLEIVKQIPENRRAPRGLNTPAIRECCDRLRSRLTDYSLSNDDYILIAVLFDRFLQRGKRVDARELADRLYPDSVKRLHVFQQIRRLVARGLLDVRGMRRRPRERHLPETEKFSLVTLVDSEVMFREHFLQQLLGDGRRPPNRSDQPFADNRDFLQGWFNYIAALKDYRDVSTYDMIGDIDNSDEDAKLRDVRTVLDSRLALTGNRFPLQDLIEEEKLDEKERDIVIYLLSEEMQDHNCSLEELIDLISEDQFERHQNRSYFDVHSRLITRGILEISNETTFLMMKRSDVRLAPDISRRLMSRTPASDRDRLGLVMQGQDIFDLADPQHSFENLIVPTELRERLETAVHRYRSKADLRLREWGIDKAQPKSRLSDNDEAPLLMLFCGPSGTGKTFAAGAFAQKLGKQLLVTDVSRILSAYVGESEQNVRRMFHLFERLVRRMDNPPVLLLNECDQFLTRRSGETSKSVDRMYHQMQNLFLESFERLRGILIATTNLAEGIDPAFSRRFHLKLEFPMPDVEARISLWKGHLPASVPLAKDVKLDRLAAEYLFSGGQIALAVRNAAVSAAVRGGRVTMKDLRSACDAEAVGARKVTGAGSRPIGFGA